MCDDSVKTDAMTTECSVYWHRTCLLSFAYLFL